MSLVLGRGAIERDLVVSRDLKGDGLLARINAEEHVAIVRQVDDVLGLGQGHCNFLGRLNASKLDQAITWKASQNKRLK